ncbi:MAG: translation elongation factor Ts [Chloroflexi bacterium]|nr:translation elongation factor Ts [Chloroflexota bacterium]
MAISIDMIKQLREETGAGVLDCRKALEQTDGDFEQAKEILREKGLATAAKRADRQTVEGVVEIYSHGNGRVGVMVEVNSETDFVGRSDTFRTFAHEIALQIAANAPRFIRDEDIPAEVIEQESDKAAARARAEGKPETILPRIIEGTLKKFKDETVLLRQVYVRDDNLTVQQLLNQAIASLGENVVIRRFARWELGEDVAE